MTLLESLIALVVLGLSAAGYLDVFQGTARSVAQANEWLRTVSIAQATMESAALGDALQAQEATGAPDQRFTRRVDVTPWVGPNGQQLTQIVVTVTSPRGATYALRRLVRGS